MPTCRLASCGKPLAARTGWESPEFCGPACRDRHIEQVIAREMGASPRVGGKRVQPRNLFCAWCGDDLPRGSRRRFCGDECRAEYVAAVAAEKARAA